MTSSQPPTSGLCNYSAISENNFQIENHSAKCCSQKSRAQKCLDLLGSQAKGRAGDVWEQHA